MADELPTLKEIMRQRKLNRRDAAEVLDKLEKAKAERDAQARRDAIEAQKVKAEADARAAASQAEVLRAQTEAAAQKAKGEIEAERLRQEQAQRDYENSWPQQAKQYGVTFGAPLVGYGVGEYLGHKDMPAYVEAANSRAGQLSELVKGANRLSPTSAADIARAQAKVAAADEMGLANRGLGAKRFGAPLGLAGLGAMTEATAPYVFDDNTNQTLQKVFGRAELGAAGGMLFNALRAGGKFNDPTSATDLAELKRLQAFPDEPAPSPMQEPAPKAAPRGKMPLSMAPDAPPAQEPAAPKATASTPKSFTEAKDAFRQRFPGQKLPANATKAGLLYALENTPDGDNSPKLPPKGGSAAKMAGKAGLLFPAAAVGEAVYSSLRSPAQAGEGDGEEAAPKANMATAAAAGLGAGAATYKGSELLGKGLDKAASAAAPYVTEALGPVAPYAGKAASLAGRMATPLMVAGLVSDAFGASPTAMDSMDSIAYREAATPAEPSDDPTSQAAQVNRGAKDSVDPAARAPLPNVEAKANAMEYAPQAPNADAKGDALPVAPQTVNSAPKTGVEQYASAVDDEMHLATQARDAMTKNPAASLQIMQRARDIAMHRGWNPSAIMEHITGAL